MGFIRDIVNSVDHSKEVADEIKENLNLLMKLAEAKAQIFEDEIVIDLKTGKTTDDLTVPVTKVVKKVVQYRAMTADSTADVIDEMATAITEMIGDSSASSIIKGISKIAGSALKTIMGTGEGTEQVSKLYTAVTDYPAIVRFDFAFWARKVKAESVKKHCETVMACVAYKSAVDVTKLAFNDFLALYGPILNAGIGSDPRQMKEMLKQAKEVYAMYSVPNALQSKALAEEMTEEMIEEVVRRDYCKPRGILIQASTAATEGDF